MQEDNRRLSGRQRAEHDHLVARRPCLLRYDTPLPARAHVSMQPSFLLHIPIPSFDLTTFSHLSAHKSSSSLIYAYFVNPLLSFYIAACKGKRSFPFMASYGVLNHASNIGLLRPFITTVLRFFYAPNKYSDYCNKP